MSSLTPADLRHIKAIVAAERELMGLTRAAYAAFLPAVLDAVLDDAAVVAAVDPDRAQRAQGVWGNAIEAVVLAASALWKKRYGLKGKNRRKMAADALKFEQVLRDRFAVVTKKVYADVAKTVAQALNSSSPDELRARLTAELQPENYESDAERIARTTTMAAYNGGAEAGFKEFAAASQQPVTKTWRTILDGNARNSHAAAHGQTVPIDAPFTVGGFLCQHPADDVLPPWESVNCRCVAEFRLGGLVAGIGASGVTFTVERSAGRCEYAEWVVVRDDTSQIVGEHASKAMAFVQLRALQEAAAEMETPGIEAEEVDEPTQIDEASPVVAAVGELPKGWRGPIAALDRLTGDRRWLATPPGGLRTRMYPMSVTRKHVSEDEDIFIGTMEAAWIQDGFVWAEGSFDLDGTDGAEAARLVGDRLLFTMSIEPDEVTAEQWLVDADGNKASDEVMARAIDTGMVPEGFEVVLAFVDWRLASVALVSIPAYDEARIEPVFDYERPTPAEEHIEHGMIALRPMDPENFAVPGGLDAADLHVTLRYLGDIKDISPSIIPGLHAAAQQAAETLRRKKKRARVAGYGQLGDSGAVVLLLNGPEIADAHAAVEAALRGDDYCTLPEAHSPFLAHMTLGYGIDPEMAKQYVGREFDFYGASFDFGAARMDYPAPVEVVATRQEQIVASVGGQIFRAAAFERKATGPTPLTVDEDGSVYGHVRLYGTCYQYGGGQGNGGYCVEPPLSACNYEKFHVHGAKLDDGRIIAVGALTYGDGHESRGGLQASRDHYNDVSFVAAKVVASEDEWGVWIAGEVCADHYDKAYDLLLSPMSGHWEPDADNNGHLEMLAAHIVVTPGYAVRGRHIMASFDDNRNATRIVIPSPWQNRTERQAEQVREPRKIGMGDLRRAQEASRRIGL